MFTSAQVQRAMSSVFIWLRCSIFAPRKDDYTRSAIICPFQQFLFQVAAMMWRVRIAMATRAHQSNFLINQTTNLRSVQDIDLKLNVLVTNQKLVWSVYRFVCPYLNKDFITSNWMGLSMHLKNSNLSPNSSSSISPDASFKRRLLILVQDLYHINSYYLIVRFI